MIAFRHESFDRMLPEILALIPGHWNETGLTVLAGHPEIRPDIDVALYRSIDRAGRLKCLAARDGTELAGYFVGIVRTLPHYRTLKMGAADAFYLRPDCRGPRTALRFFEAAERMMLEAQPRILMLHSKIGPGVDHGRLFEAMGYRPNDRTFLKFVEPAHG